VRIQVGFQLRDVDKVTDVALEREHKMVTQPGPPEFDGSILFLFIGELAVPCRAFLLQIFRTQAYWERPWWGTW
jgi:hypothetical protein